MRAALTAPLFLLFLATNSLGLAEPFSIRCVRYEGVPEMDFHFTFDLGFRKVVFETSAGRVVRGEIENLKDGQLEFTIDEGEAMKLRWDARQKKLFLPDSSQTAPLNCTEIPLRPAGRFID